ncbi:hypothetical protein NCER_101488 [Vairimorpha ceranae BRL01]|uniref:Vacuolar import and degradation protein n=2 Tax=Vairimorpha ceranae TaxID=40302 RepID=C4VA50_VAIC1|nr:vacuolar import and degradation protein [Vairimorpha ceranae]EEQ81902.1 hypothetical protein NCER_101488 [Vairimorpha ceranae BRL01]KAF5140395.1 hypothetical protein G9O61_00g015030 [Vairimorpha ceranae]KKO74475.1 vacuolar import and degradation protein [Vairimorpha ceranae]
MIFENGSKYVGEQLSIDNSFCIEMKIDNINYVEEVLCGTFKIYNSDKTYIKLSTYFEALIIGNLHPFYTEETGEDKEYWKRLPGYSDSYSFKYSNYIYLKMKELFILPDASYNTSDASIDGCYYCCYCKNLDCFIGHYLYKNENRNLSQEILLERINERTKGVACFV